MKSNSVRVLIGQVFLGVAVALCLIYLVNFWVDRVTESSVENTQWKTFDTSYGKVYYNDLANPDHLDIPCHYICFDKGWVAFPIETFGPRDVSRAIKILDPEAF